MPRTYVIVLDTADDGRTRIEPLNKLLQIRYKSKGQTRVIEESSLGDTSPFLSFKEAAVHARERAAQLLKLHSSATLSIGSARFVLGWGMVRCEITCLSLSDPGGPVVGATLLDTDDRALLAEMTRHQEESLRGNSKGGSDPKIAKLALYVATGLSLSLAPTFFATN